MARARRPSALEPWPGYVDALSTLLMVTIFVLLVFALAQGFLSSALSTRDAALERLNRQAAELAELLALERTGAEELRSLLARAADDLRGVTAARDALSVQLRAAVAERDRDAEGAVALRSERDQLRARLADLDAARAGTAQRLTGAESQLTEALSRAEAAQADAAGTLRRLNATARELATERDALAAERSARAAADARIAEQGRALSTERAARAAAETATAERDRRLRETEGALATERNARAAADARIAEQGRALAAERTARAAAEAATAERDRRLRDSEGALATARADLATLRREAEAAAAQLAQARRDIAALREAQAALDRTVQADRATIEARLSDIARLQAEVARLNALREQAQREAQAALEAERRGAAAENARLSEAARAQVALLTQQLEALRRQLNRLANALDAAEARDRENDAQVVNLRAQLNAALAQRVEELQRYRSEFFGRLREVLGDRPELRVVGDRFVFQSELLFPPASADLSPAGTVQLRQLSRVLLDIAARIPPDVPWLLRVDGHADRNPIRGGRFASNWELSAARAIAVANLMMEAGLPANRIAAAAFGEHQPLDNGDTPEALARNRRIELRLTDR